MENSSLKNKKHFKTFELYCFLTYMATPAHTFKGIFPSINNRIHLASESKTGGYMAGGSSDSKSNSGLVSRISNSISGSGIMFHGKRAASDAAYVTKKLLRSTGKAAWIAGTTFVILVVPLIIEMDREQQLNDLDLQQATLLGTTPLPARN